MPHVNISDSHVLDHIQGTIIINYRSLLPWREIVKPAEAWHMSAVIKGRKKVEPNK